MKKNGPIPPHFSAGEDGSLAIGGVPAGDILPEGDAPAFAYSCSVIERKIAQFRADMPDRLALHYAVKANPYRPLLDFISSHVDGLDLASRGELARVDGIDLPLSMAGPGKSVADLEGAISAGVTVHLESEGEAKRALDVADRLGVTPKLAVRVNPPFALKGAGMKMGGLSSQFGVDAERVPNLVRSLLDAGADWHGFHLYAGSQSLSADAIIESQRESLRLVVGMAREIGVVPAEVNLGGGFGIPYFPGDEPLDTKAVGAALDSEFNDLPDDLSDTRLMLELGRWLVGEAGVYLTRVIDRKVSHGRTYLVTDGGLQHMLAASGNFGQLLRRNYPVANATRFADEPREEASVVGRLCTPLDLLADEIMLPRTDVGDIIAVFCAGAYGLTASPNDFLSQPMASELLVD